MKSKNGKRLIAIITTALIVVAALSLAIFTVAWYSASARTGILYEVDASGFFMLYFDSEIENEDAFLLPAVAKKGAVLDGDITPATDLFITNAPDPNAHSVNPASPIDRAPVGVEYMTILNMRDALDTAGTARNIRLDFNARSRRMDSGEFFNLNFNTDISLKVTLYIYENGTSPIVFIPGTGEMVHAQDADGNYLYDDDDNKVPTMIEINAAPDFENDTNFSQYKELELSQSKKNTMVDPSDDLWLTGDSVVYIKIEAYLLQVDELCEPGIREYGVRFTVGAQFYMDGIPYVPSP
jgi:hypothetical protein